MFQGLVLGDLQDSVNPYPESEDPKSVVIEDRADVSLEDYSFGEPDIVGQIKELRADLQDQLDNLVTSYTTAHESKIKPERMPLFPSHILMSISNCEKAKMWLGMALNHIKENA